MRFVINQPQAISERFESEVIVINLETGTYFSLRETAADAWLRLEAGQGVEEILSAWQKHLPQVDDAYCQLGTFIERLLAEGLLREGEAVKVEFSGLQLASYSEPKLEVYTDMQDLLLLDPIHDVDETGWPAERKP